MAVRLVTGPDIEPVSLDEAKGQCRVDISTDDVLIQGLVQTAREMAETITRRALITQTWELVLDGFPDEDRLTIPLPPLQSVTVKYTDADDVEATFSSASYVVDTYNEPGRIVLRSDATWPNVTLREANGVAVRFVAGYGDAAADVPQAIRQAMLLMVGHWYENREETVATGNVQRIPLGIEALLWPYRVLRWL